jgi:hypothetical protein
MVALGFTFLIPFALSSAPAQLSDIDLAKDFWEAAGGEARYETEAGKQELTEFLSKGAARLRSEGATARVDEARQNSRTLGQRLAAATKGQERPRLTRDLVQRVIGGVCPGFYPFC